MINRETLKRVIAEQRDQFLKLENPIQRDAIAGADFEKIAGLKEAVLITGVRRSGKSYLLKMIWQKIVAAAKNGKNAFFCVNFEDERLPGFSARDFDLLLETYYEMFLPAGKTEKIYLFFDEIQIVEGWEKFINRLLRDERFKIFITGSNAALLSKEIGTALTGRFYPLALYPLSFKEFLRFKRGELPPASRHKAETSGEIKRIFNDYLENGGFPEVVLQNFRPLLQEYLKSIVYRDIVLRYRIKNETSLKEIASFVISNIGAAASLENIAKMTRMKNLTTVKNYLSYLENSFLFHRVSKYSHSIKEQIYNPDKFYCVDTGLYNEIAFLNSANRGRLLENMVFMELKRRGKDVFYFKGAKECDFAIKEKTKITGACQVTKELSPANEKRELGGLREAMDNFGLDEGLIITEGQEEERKTDGKKIRVVSLCKWLLE